MQKYFFEENKGFEYSFYQIEVQVVTNPSSRLEKEHQVLVVLLMADFLRILKKKSFVKKIKTPHFPKIISSTY